MRLAFDERRAMRLRRAIVLHATYWHGSVRDVWFCVRNCSFATRAAAQGSMNSTEYSAWWNSIEVCDASIPVGACASMWKWHKRINQSADVKSTRDHETWQPLRVHGKPTCAKHASRHRRLTWNIGTHSKLCAWGRRTEAWELCSSNVQIPQYTRIYWLRTL
jgi:hypothetical protein